VSIQFKTLWAFALFLILSCAFAIYQQGKTGALFYDDLSNLSALAEIETSADARQFVFDGTAGPLGRPLSLASFLPHAGKWPQSSSNAILVNIAIHLINALLLLGVGYLLTSRSGLLSAKQSMAAALMAMTLWVFMPLLASTTLIVVQRMTGLASLFGLTGLLGYLWLYKTDKAESFIHLCARMIILFGFTLLAMLAKENGAVFPVYALIAEGLLLRRSAEHNFYSGLRISILIMYSAGLVGYLLYQMPADLFAVNPYRGFSVFDRLATQPIILWEYIRLALIPSLNEYGPFQDDVMVVNTYGYSMIAVSFFLGLLALGIKLRKRFPLMLVAVLWFLVGHLIESSVIMLELYFEHRNYIAIYAVCLMLAVSVFLVNKRYRKLLMGAFLAYASLQLLVLAMLASIWGKPIEAAEHWAKVKPESSRAIMALSESYFRNLSDPSYANTALDRGVETCSDCLDIYMQALIYGCLGEERASIEDRYNMLIEAAPKGRFTPAMLDGVYPVRKFIKESHCGSLTLKDLAALLEAMEVNPRFESIPNKIHLTYLQAVVAADQENWERALSHLERLFAIQTIFGGVTLKAQILQYRHGKKHALDYLTKVSLDPGDIGGVNRIEWDRRLQGFTDDMKNQAGKNTIGIRNE